MQANHECEASRGLQSALKAKAKIVGIPIPGHAPLIFMRTKLQRCLKGVLPTSVIAVVNGNARWLCIEGNAGRVRTKMRMLSMSRSDALRLMDDKDKFSARLTRPKSTKYDAAITKLEKEMGSAPVIQCGWNRRVRKFDEYDRQRWASWRADKTQRTTHFRKEMKRTSRELAKINTGCRRPGSSYQWEPKPEEMWGPARYSAYLVWRKYTAPIRAQIADIRALKLEDEFAKAMRIAETMSGS